MGKSGMFDKTMLFMIIAIIVAMGELWSGCIVVDDDPDRTASLGMVLSPSTVTPVFDATYREWRWYFGIVIEERNDVGVWLDSLNIRYYNLNGGFEYETDYSSSIGPWFGSTWLPPDGTLRHLDGYWHNSDGSSLGWQAIIRVSGLDENGYRVSTSAEVICQSAQEAASLSCLFNPPSVNPIYDYDSGEYRWYVDWNICENAGLGVQLDRIIIDFYTLSGNFEESVDYTSYLTDWFGTTWLPGYGQLICRDRYWTNADRSGTGWKMKYTYYGRDVIGNYVQCSCWVTLFDASYYRDHENDNHTIVEGYRLKKFHRNAADNRGAWPELKSIDEASRFAVIDME